jgi:hypothetical protein
MRCKTTGRVIMGLVCAALLSFSATVTSAQQLATENAKPAPPQGAITGRVVSSGGEPIPGASVYLSALGSASQQRSSTVDAGGNFKLDGLDAGAYFVSAGAPGFTVETQPTVDSRRFSHPGDSLTLTLVKGGVITGTVTTSTNGPVINANVRVFRVKDGNGQPVQGVAQPRERFTDDRGVYRVYGLPPGSYVVSAGGPGRYFGLNGSQYENDAPTYAPSSSRDTAVEIFVRAGDEMTADIQYRGEPGHSISGAVAGFPQAQSMIPSNASIFLTDVRSHTAIMTANASAYNSYSFAFYGVADGEYELFAQRYAAPPADASASEPKRVKVQGADLTGVTLTLMPLASIAGRLVLESNPPADCVKRRLAALQETVIGARRFTPEAKPPARQAAKDQSATPEPPLNLSNQSADTVADAKGDLTLRNLHAGSYRINSQLPGAGWYLRSISIGPPPAIAKPSDPNIPRDGIALKSGQRVAGLTVTITEGAGGLRGRISAPEGQRASMGLRVYLVPAERENAENVLRFFEAATDAEASFAISNIAPGRYWILARGADDGDPAKVKPIRQESNLRARVLHEAEALKKDVSFKPCERLADYEVAYSPPATPGP